MEIQLIRNATMRLGYGGKLILTDPYLAPKLSLRSFAGISKNPLVELPSPPRQVIEGTDLVIVSHLHTDHFDSLAQGLLPKSLPLFCQPGDASLISEMGFESVTAIVDPVHWEGIEIARTPGQHGTGEWAERMGDVSGFVFRAAGEPVVYWAGDTIWYGAVAQLVSAQQPDVIITHSSGAKFGESDPIVMDAQQTVAVCRAAPGAVVVAVHMDSLDHGTVSRQQLRALADAEGIDRERLLIPGDGEAVTLA
jgi:L-ascorbate metabolism protein UlaG (beta-lactamase superfamily)